MTLVCGHLAQQMLLKNFPITTDMQKRYCDIMYVHRCIYIYTLYIYCINLAQKLCMHVLCLALNHS